MLPINKIGLPVSADVTSSHFHLSQNLGLCLKHLNVCACPPESFCSSCSTSYLSLPLKFVQLFVLSAHSRELKLAPPPLSCQVGDACLPFKSPSSPHSTLPFSSAEALAFPSTWFLIPSLCLWFGFLRLVSQRNVAYLIMLPPSASPSRVTWEPFGQFHANLTGAESSQISEFLQVL